MEPIRLGQQVLVGLPQCFYEGEIIEIITNGEVPIMVRVKDYYGNISLVATSNIIVDPFEEGEEDEFFTD